MYQAAYAVLRAPLQSRANAIAAGACPHRENLADAGPDAYYSIDLRRTA